MNFTVEYYFYFFSGTYMQLHLFAAILFLLGATFLKGNYKTESYNLLYVFNTLAAWCILLYLLFYLGELFLAWYGQNSYEWYAFSSDNTSVINTLPWMLVKIYFPVVLGLLLFFRKLRSNRWFTFIFLLVTNIDLIEKLYNRFSRDYLPSYWSFPGLISLLDILLGYLVILILLVVIYFIAKKRNKLPCPSVFLK
ncbi:hypothetical protein [Ferruginibacter sp. SUN106]|uniref:hypothetical protein n=1 Tax=Ferruginibacter sp. SUN106 TaxID=2978348 RepID=UPI003D36BD02